MNGNWNKSLQPHKDEIIYEFKYSFPKGWGDRVERIIDRINWLIVLLASLLFLCAFYEGIFYPTIKPIFASHFNMQTLLGIFVLLLVFFILQLPLITMIVFSLHTFILQPHNTFVLTSDGIYINATRGILLWKTKQFYPYGTFSLMTQNIWGLGFSQSSLAIKICDDIDKEYRLFDFKHSKFFTFAINGENDIKEFLQILREKTQEALQRQGRAEKYNLKEKIKDIDIKEW
ncbi:hypothetical protein [Helicobacter sp.]|uniref:hypothetical protein n=1 Tax=Helicobacter sp. TaxID=218 RepID=UPI00199E4B6F|nr:hypothetical protein [Helicobacter sp.]MBD5165896.1 hypothetical protein [Helicobacter sp.]